MDISGWVDRRAGWAPASAALRFEGRTLSYGEVERAIAGTAGRLRADGVAAGDRVAYLGPNCPELLVGLLACARLGAVFVPLNARMPAAELAAFTALATPVQLLAEDDFAAVAREVAAGAPVTVFTAGGGLPEGPPVAADTVAGADDPALIAFTSGTTGRPRGATHTHATLAADAVSAITAYALTADDEILTVVPMFHAGGLFIHTLPGLCAGATVTIHRTFEPGAALAEIAERGITRIACHPAITLALAAHPAWPGADLSSLRSVVTGATIVPRRAVEPWHARGVSVSQAYGMTETTPVVCTMPPGSPPETAFTAGRPTVHNAIRIVDPAGSDVAPGETGEVWIRGPGVTPGYWANPEATREAVADGWWRSGDIGRIGEDGCLRIVDRLKDVIIVGGSNVCPSDLEAVLGECPDIADAIVLGKPDATLGEVPVAVVVPAAGSALSAARILALFDGRLAAYKHPRAVVFLDALPRNPTGKVDRRRLAEIVTSGPTRGDAGHPPRAPGRARRAAAA